MYEIVDSITHRETPFDKIQWYIILSLGYKYFFNTFATTEYEPVYTHKVENGNVIPLEVNHIDMVLKIYEISGAKMERHRYNLIMSIRKQINRDLKIGIILND